MTCEGAEAEAEGEQQADDSRLLELGEISTASLFLLFAARGWAGMTFKRIFVRATDTHP